MINKVGKIFNKGLTAPKVLKGNIKKGTRLASDLGTPNKIKNIASGLNTIESNVKKSIGKIDDRVNKTAYKNASNRISEIGSFVQTSGEFLEEEAYYKFAGNVISKAGNKLKHVPIHDKAVGFDIKKAVKNDLKLHANQAINFAGSMLETTDKNLLGVKLSGRGKLVAGGLAVASGTSQASKQFNERTMGTQRDSGITPHAPRIPSYANNGGATGDLVFALNANRRG